MLPPRRRAAAVDAPTAWWLRSWQPRDGCHLARPATGCHRRSAVTRDPSEVDCSRADSADARGSLAAGARAGAGSGSDVQTGKPKEVARSDTGAGAGVEERAPQNSLI